jgi:hypothetical protein
LAAAHDQGVIHRDLSPDNVILPGGDLSKAKIIDFGISKMADPEAKTIIGEDFAGKYSYVSPEQVGMHGGKVDARSDIYSLGLVLAAAALGKPLDMGSSPISVVEARRTVPDLSRVPAELRADLTAMLQPDPANRPQSLQQLLPQRGRRSSDVEDRPKAKKKARQAPAPTENGASGSGLRTAIAALAVVLVLAIGGGVGYLLYWPPPGPRPPIPPTLPIPPTPQTTGPDIDALTRAAQAAIKGFDCSGLSVQVTQTAQIDVVGYVASDADRQQVVSRLQGLPDAGRVTDRTAVMQWPLCEAIGVVHDETFSVPGDSAIPQIDPGGRAGLYFEGESLRIDVTNTPLYDGYLYIDYIDGKGGYVVHLFPTELRPNNSVRKSAKVEIGALEQEVRDYVVKPPFGVNLIIAVATPEPLFPGVRPQIEYDAKTYLTELR